MVVCVGSGRVRTFGEGKGYGVEGTFSRIEDEQIGRPRTKDHGARIYIELVAVDHRRDCVAVFDYVVGGQN